MKKLSAAFTAQRQKRNDELRQQLERMSKKVELLASELLS